MFSAKKLARRGTTTTTTTTNSSQDVASSKSFTVIPSRSSSSHSPDNSSSGFTWQAQSNADQANHNEVATSDYAKKCKALMELYRALRSMGLELTSSLTRIHSSTLLSHTEQKCSSIFRKLRSSALNQVYPLKPWIGSEHSSIVLSWKKHFDRGSFRSEYPQNCVIPSRH